MRRATGRDREGQRPVLAVDGMSVGGVGSFGDTTPDVYCEQRGRRRAAGRFCRGAPYTRVIS
eukprot:584186-Prymnesium_polylepis.1